MNQEKRNCNIYELSHKCFETEAIELLMRSMREEEKNIWRVDYHWLREEMKTCFFYHSDLADSLLSSIKDQMEIPFRIRGALLLGLVIRNCHWSILEGEFFRLYGSLRIPVSFLFEDYVWLRGFYALQHQGEWAIPSIESTLEWTKSIQSDWFITHYQPKSWEGLDHRGKVVRVERGRVNWIQKIVGKEAFPVAGELEKQWGKEAECSPMVVNQWRIAMDRLQRRPRKGIGNAELPQCKIQGECNHAWLGPLQIQNRVETSTHVEIEARGILRTYNFRYKKKRS